MLNLLIQSSLRQRALVLALAVVLLVMGTRKAMELPVDVLPDLTKPTVTLLTEAPGYAPEEVETLVTIPLENALMGVTGVTRLRATNDIALSLIFIEFDWGTDIYRARQFVQERLTSAVEFLPDGITPYMTPAASLMGDIMMVGLRDPTGSTPPRELRALAEWDVGKRLQAIPGVAEVLAMGGGMKQVQVQPDPEQMLALGVSLAQLRQAASQAARNTTGGFLTERDQEVMVRHLGMTTDLDAIGDTVVRHEDDRAIRIRDVASVVWDIGPMRGDAGMGTRPKQAGEPARGDLGVIINLRKSPGFDTIALTGKVEAVLEDLRKSLPEGVELITLYRQQDYIDLSIGNLKEALRDGAVMVAIVLFLFLFNLRVTVITLTAIPLSLAISVLVFDLLGVSVNSMTLGGFAVAIGMVVDDAIVDVENVYRRLRENAALTSPQPKLQIIASASAEVRSSIFYATVLIILVFLPLFALSGVEGRLFTPIAIATIVSMAASFVVSLTVIPVLSSFFIHPEKTKAQTESWTARTLKHWFAATWLRFSLSQPLLVCTLTGLLIAVSAHAFTRMGGNFLPPFREPTAVVAMTTAPGTSLKTTTEISQTAQDLLLQIPGVETVGYRVGRAERGDHVVPVSTVEFDIEFTPEGEHRQQAVLEDIRQTMRGIPGTFSAMSGPLADRVGHMLSGVSAKIALKIFGPDLEELRRLGEEAATIARAIPGLEEARTEQQATIPQLRIEVDRQRALAYGITPGQLNDDLASLMGGETVAEVYEGQHVYDLVIRLPRAWREDPGQLEQLYIDTESGQPIPLRYVAEVRQAAGPNTILRENTLRRFVVSINPTTPNLNHAVEQLQTNLDQALRLPEGYSIAFEGEYQAQEEAKHTILIASAVILIIIVFLLYSYFQSFRLAALVLTNIPISLVGGILYTQHMLDNVSIATLVGFIAISGIASRNHIMMLSHYLHLMRHEGERFDQSMVIRGTLERIVPVLMTALSAGIALIPFVLAADEPGKEILSPVAIVITGGLVTSTVLGLGVTPTLFYHTCRRAAERAIQRHAPASE